MDLKQALRAILREIHKANVVRPHYLRDYMKPTWDVRPPRK